MTVAADPTAAFRAERAALLADTDLHGTAWCSASSAITDRWMARLYDGALADGSTPRRAALVAVGGYGRGELCPGSDLDVLLLHDGKGGGAVTEIADRVWYPVWDVGLKLGHALRSVKESLALAADDLDTATSLLTCRHLAGDPSLTAELHDAAHAQWRKRAARWLGTLGRSVEERHADAGEVSFLLEPNLKEGRGGLRDVHALGWAESARAVLTDLDRKGLGAAYGALLAARVDLHRVTGRSRDVLALQEQDAVAAALGDADADALMARIARSGRAIAWPSDEVWRRIGASMHGGRKRQDRVLNERLVLLDGEVHVRHIAGQPLTTDIALEAAATAAELATSLDQPSLRLLAAEAAPVPPPWPEATRERFARILLAGRPAVGVIEALDQLGIWERYLPEWPTVRCKPQRNAYHRFTVDRHLVEAAVNASALADRVERPDLLVVGTLLHDIGKGYPGDHTVVGCDLVRTIGARMGYAADEVEDLVAMVEHHLLLPDVASRRDLGDPDTIAAVAAAVGTPRRLELLAALTESDSLATGPAAWSHWKAGLVAQLVERTGQVLAGADAASVVDAPAAAPTLEEGGDASGARILVEAGQITVTAADAPGTFSRIAGVLALHGLTVLAAQAWSEAGTGASRFTVDQGGSPPAAERLEADIRRALSGRLAIEARLADRAATYATGKVRQPKGAKPTVRFDNAASGTATVIDVEAPDAVGLLYRVTRALADLDLDLRTALVQTLGPRVADAFYVTDRDGRKVEDATHLAEIERAVLFAVG